MASRNDGAKKRMPSEKLVLYALVVCLAQSEATLSYSFSASMTSD